MAVGLTGGIASGKSVVAAVLAQRGALVISADDEAKMLLRNEPGVARRVRRLLGPAAYLPDGRPDRLWIARRIFSDPAARRALNAIIHPVVIASIRRRIDAERLRGKLPLVVVEAALVFEAGMERLFDVIVVVDAPVAVRAARIVSRDGVSRAEALRRIRAQGANRAKSAAAGIVVRNTGNLRSLRSAGRLLDRVLRLLGRGDASPVGARKGKR